MKSVMTALAGTDCTLSAMCCAGATPDPLDHSFVWQLHDVLQAVDAVPSLDSIGQPAPQVSFLSACAQHKLLPIVQDQRNQCTGVARANSVGCCVLHQHWTLTEAMCLLSSKKQD